MKNGVKNKEVKKLSKFPELPPLPDISLPLKKLAEGVGAAANGLKVADEAGEQLTESVKKTRENIEKIMKRKPVPLP